MLDALKDFSIYLAIALACLAVAGFLSAHKQKILTKLREAVQRAEIAVQGSKMGTEKKEMVIAELEANGVKFTAWTDRMIDCTVAYLNMKGGWLKTLAQQKLDGAATNATVSALGGNPNA